ncbi:hypothetical protein ADIMK_2215 [Marinobacterium lacunae]|uniref:Uncharacterized protein n=1 Tax=Marinobacterium lacunae TaxID=1232683 RepID=A0A081FYP4_9GAMM|nr:hypothetical protein ADIMK_2215 [Marinobacterium lacunae]
MIASNAYLRRLHRFSDLIEEHYRKQQQEFPRSTVRLIFSLSQKRSNESRIFGDSPLTFSATDKHNKKS